MLPRTENRAAAGHRARARIARRLLPYLFVLYIISYLDRVNLSYAALQMTKDLNLSDRVFGIGAGIFFVGYFVLEIPGTILVETWSARGWIARIMITWGILAAGMGLVHTPNQFYWVRFFLGAAEAGFFPGLLIYLSHWFCYEDRAKAVALFMAALPVSSILGAPASGVILTRAHWLGIAGWRWLFFIEGAPAIVFGVITVLYLTDWPRQARWLPEDERDWIESQLKAENETKELVSQAGIHTSIWVNIWGGLRNINVILLALTYFFIITGFYGVNFWLPTILKRLSGLPDLMVTTISALPYLVGLVAMLLVGWSSDKSGERRWHAAAPMLIASLGLFGIALTQGSGTGIVAGIFCLAAVGLYGFFPAFWSLPGRFLSGTAAAASVGLINSVGNLGGYLGPFMVGRLAGKNGSFVGGMAFLSICALVGACLVLMVRNHDSEPALPGH